MYLITVLRISLQLVCNLLRLKHRFSRRLLLIIFQNCCGFKICRTLAFLTIIFVLIYYPICLIFVIMIPGTTRCNFISGASLKVLNYALISILNLCNLATNSHTILFRPRNFYSAKTSSDTLKVLMFVCLTF